MRWNQPVIFLSIIVLSLIACSKSPATSTPDAGAVDGGDGGADASIDAGDEDAGCAALGAPCDFSYSCCDGQTVICDPVSSVCVLDAGTVMPDGGDGGETFPSDEVQWVSEPVTGNVVALNSLTTPSGQLQLAGGAGGDVGQLLVRSSDGGWSPLAGVPQDSAIFGVWADSSGDIFAVGSSDAGVGLFLAGTVDGGLSAVNLDAGPAFTSLQAVMGLGPHEAIAVGTPVDYTQIVAFHLLPDGGVLNEPMPEELGRLYKLAGGGAYPIYALAESPVPSLPPWVVVRGPQGWTQAIEVFSVVNLSDIAVGPDGDITIVGDDGDGHGVAYSLIDGGFTPAVQVASADAGFTLLGPAVPSLTAICEPSPGEFFLATAQDGQGAQILHVTGGLLDGGWATEVVPSSVQQINAISGDGTGEFYAVGLTTSELPAALRRLP